MPAESITVTFYDECSDEDVDNAMARLVPQAPNPLIRNVTTTPEKFGSVNRAYIECLRDNAILIAMQRAMIAAQPCEKVFTIDTDHSPFYSAPEELAALLLQLAQ